MAAGKEKSTKRKVARGGADNAGGESAGAKGAKDANGGNGAKGAEGDNGAKRTGGAKQAGGAKRSSAANGQRGRRKRAAAAPAAAAAAAAGKPKKPARDGADGPSRPRGGSRPSGGRRAPKRLITRGRPGAPGKAVDLGAHRAARLRLPPLPLADVAAAMHGDSADALGTVIGDDERVRIADTRVFPYCAIASLEIIAADGSTWVGTGWFISPRTVITAGHCVFVHSQDRPQSRGWVKKITVRPGRDGNAEPFQGAVSERFISVDGWIHQADPRVDYGAIFLPVPLGARVGQIGFAAATDRELREAELTLCGYPADKLDEETGTQWRDRRRAVDVSPTNVYYDMDTAGGQSGAPLLRTDANGVTAVAIHAYGTGGSVRNNSATRITAEVYENLRSWMER